MKPFTSLLFVVLSIMYISVSAQKTDVASSYSGNIQIVKDYRLDLILEKMNKSDQTRGFRVQIHSGPRSEAARKVKSKFLQLFPQHGCYETYQQPNFVVIAGNFFTKLEAQKFLNSIREHFPNAFIIPDVIDPLNLKGK